MGSKSGAIEDTAAKFTRSVRFLATPDRMMWPSYLSRDWKWPRDHSRVVCLRLEGNLIIKHVISMCCWTWIWHYVAIPDVVTLVKIMVSIFICKLYYCAISNSFKWDSVCAAVYYGCQPRMRRGNVFSHIRPSVCLSVRHALTCENLDLQSSFLVCTYIFRIFMSSSY